MSFSSKRFDLKGISEFEDFCGEHELDFSSVDKTRAERLREWLANGNPLSDIVQLYEGKVDQLAIDSAYLFSLKLLTREQVGTILEYREMLSGFPNPKQKNLLNKNGELSTEAKDELAHFLNTDEQEKFLAFIKEKPPSEQCYFEVTIPEDDLKNERLRGLLELSDKLKIIRMHTKPIIFRHGFDEADASVLPKTTTITFLSMGAREALTKAIYGKHTKTLLPRVGKFDKDDIARSMMNNARYDAVSYPGIENDSGFHRITARTLYLSLHDEVHRRLGSSIPNGPYEAMLYAIHLVREKTGIVWSKEIWDSIDMEVGDFIMAPENFRKSADNSIYAVLTFFIPLLKAKILTEDRVMHLFTPSACNDTTWLLMIDLACHARQWIDLGILPMLFSGGVYAAMFHFAIEHQEEIEKIASPAKQVAILKLKYFGLEDVTSDDVVFVKEKKSNYLHVLVDGKPLVASKSDIIRLMNFGIDVDAYVKRGFDLSQMAKIQDKYLSHLKEGPIFDLIMNQKITFEEFSASSLKLIDRLNMKAIYELVLDDKLTIQEAELLPVGTIASLSSSLMKNLLETKKITLDEVKRIPPEAALELTQPATYFAIVKGKTTVEDVVKKYRIAGTPFGVFSDTEQRVENAPTGTPTAKK